MPVEFSYYFHYCRNLKFEDRPDYNTLKSLFADLLSTRINLKEEVIFDWFDEENTYREKKKRELELSGRKIEEELKDDKKLNINDVIVKEESKEESNIKIEKKENSETPGRQNQNEMKDSISSASDDLEKKNKPSKREDLVSEENENKKGEVGVGGLIDEKNSVSTDVNKNK